MKIKITIKKETGAQGFPVTKITHIKAMKNDGTYVKFAKHTDKLIDIIQRMLIDVPDEVVE